MIEMDVINEDSSEAGPRIDGQDETSICSVERSPMEGPLNSTALPQILENGGEDSTNTAEEREPLNRANSKPEQEDLVNLPSDTTETFTKVIKVFDRQPPDGCQKLFSGAIDEPDAPVPVIVTEKMEKIIDQLFAHNNCVHWVNNVMPVFEQSPQNKEKKQEEKKELLAELRSLASLDTKVEAPSTQDEADTTGVSGHKTISLMQYQLYTAKQSKKVRNKVLLEETNDTARFRAMTCRKLKNTIQKEEPGERLLRYIKAIGEAKKLYISPTRIAIPMLSLLLLVVWLVQTTEIADQLKFDTKQTGQSWRYFTYSLVHETHDHFILNFIVLLPVGWGLEVAHGSIWVLLLYAIGVVSSAMAYYVFDEGTLVGCSGGVFCLLAASLSTCIMNWNQDKVVLVKFWRKEDPFAYAGKLTRCLKVVGLLSFALPSFGTAAWRRYHHEDAGVSVLAHVFGALTGFLTGFSLLKDERGDRWKKAWKPIFLCVFSVGFGMALAINIVESRYACKLFSFETCSA